MDGKALRSFREEIIWRNKTKQAVTTNFETSQAPNASSHSSNASPRQTRQDRHQQHCRMVNNLRPVGTSARSRKRARKLSLGLLLDTSRCRHRKNCEGPQISRWTRKVQMTTGGVVQILRVSDHFLFRVTHRRRDAVDEEMCCTRPCKFITSTLASDRQTH